VPGTFPSVPWEQRAEAFVAIERWSPEKGFDRIVEPIGAVRAAGRKMRLHIAHSTTLGLATLGVLHVPGPPVEAAIALSILLLAPEIARRERGDLGLTARWPWVVAFIFGLLHGFGFASAMSDIGLPQGEIPLALLAFNVGVECGQLAFVAVVSILAALARRLRFGGRFERLASDAAPYAIGVPAAFWFFERLATF
jgi:hydrogenase/urease accessory protein HupE